MVIYMFLNSLAIKCIKKYQQNKAIIGSGRCKHYPSCSNYAIGCYEKFNFIKASFLTLFRIIRCNPFTRKMYDPVPLTRKEKIALKEKQKSLELFNPYLLNEFKNYPLMQVQDFITYIYEATFGSYYLKEKERFEISKIGIAGLNKEERYLEYAIFQRNLYLITK